MASLSVTITKYGNTATIKGYFTGGDPSYGTQTPYHRLLVVSIQGIDDDIEILSIETSGSNGTFSTTITGVTHPASYYSWVADLYVRSSTGTYIYNGEKYEKTSYSDSGQRMNDGGTPATNYQLRVYGPMATTRYLKLQFNANGGTNAPSAVTGQATGSGLTYIEVVGYYGEQIDSGDSGNESNNPWVNISENDNERYIWPTVTDDITNYQWIINVDGVVTTKNIPTYGDRVCHLDSNTISGATNIQVRLKRISGDSDSNLVVVNIPEQEPTRTNWKFAGWSTNAQGDPPIRYPGGTYTNTGSISYSSPATYTLYAVWTQNGDPYIWINIGGGTSSWKKYIMWINIGGGPSSWYKIRVWVDTNSGNHWKGGVQ